MTIAEDVTYEPAIYNRLKIMAEQNFAYKLMVDDLPSTTVYKKDVKTTNSEARPQVEYDDVIPVARKNIKHTGPMKDELKLMNHLVLNIQTHTNDNGAIRIVGFEVEAFSVDWDDSPCQGDLTSKGH